MPRPARTPTAREPLTRERVLRAAVALADERGLDEVSMRKLGQRLGVEAMSLYNHVEGKEDVLAGMVELVLREIEPPPAALHWKQALRHTAVSAHDAFLRHRWACGLAMRVQSSRPLQMEWSEAVLRTFRQAGFSANLTHHAYHVLDSHITGFTLWQANMPFQTRDELLAFAAEALPRIPADRFPYLVEHAEQHLAPPNPDERPEFEFGLDLILEGLERLRDAEV